MVVSANLFAYLVLLILPMLVTVFSWRVEPHKATVNVLLVSYLLLPVGLSIDVIGLPPLDKNTIPIYLLLTLFLLRKEKLRINLESKMMGLLLAGVILSPLCTLINNTESITYGESVFLPMTIKDVVSATNRNVIYFVLPFIFGYNLCRSDRSQYYLVFALAVTGLLYSLLMLWEIRMSPQLHLQAYGYFPHSWIQQFREGGFRPVVFIGHGLKVSFFGAIVAISLATIWKGGMGVLSKFGVPLTIYVMFVVILCKTLSALAYVLIGIVIVVLIPRKAALLVCALIAVSVWSYPITRQLDIIPVDQIASLIESYSPQRANSFRTRIENEDRLLAKASEKFAFGWGPWGRSRVYDNETGQDITISDGTWMIILGQWGVFGYFSLFGLLCYPLVRFSRARDYPAHYLGLSVILAIGLIDQIPNSGFITILALIAGSLHGRRRVSETA